MASKVEIVSGGGALSGTRFGNYVGVCRYFRRKIGNTEYIVAIAGAYDAFGLIGPEHNGIVILDDTHKNVICDRIAEADTGYFGPSQEQYDTFDRLNNMTDPEFRDFVNAHPRTRFDI